MNVKQVKTNPTLVPIKQMISATPTTFASSETSSKKTGNADSLTMAKDLNGTHVLIVSRNAFVSDFLRGLVEAHGYEAQEVLDFYEAQVQVQNGWPDVVFIDDSYLEIEHTEKFELRTQNLFQKGVPIILLANEHTKQQVERIPTMKFLKIVGKPLDYLQLGQVMADLTNV